MTDLTAKRTLVKSPPELWAELSEVESLTRHLGEFGEIKITRTDPQTTVAWEGEHASGTVELEESGWGTKVTLTAEMAQVEVAAPEPPPREQAVEIADIQPTVESPALVIEPPASERNRFFGRWRRRRRERTEAVEDLRPEPVMAAAISDGALTVMEKGHVPRVPAEPEPELYPEPEPEPEVQAALAVLETTLDNLGQAHHRPFSRG